MTRLKLCPMGLFALLLLMVSCGDEKGPPGPVGGGKANRPTMDVTNAYPDLDHLPPNPLVLMETSMGDLKIELYTDQAPITVKNFLTYVTDGFYDGTVFHRVKPKFVIQGGGYSDSIYQVPPGSKKTVRSSIKNEADNGLKNLHYTLSMARTKAKDSATSQFFINLKDNKSLDHRNEAKFGYAVFGKVIEGMEVVDRIAKVDTMSIPGVRDEPEVPVEPIKILSAKYLGEASTKAP